MLNHLHRQPGDHHDNGSMQGWGKSYDSMVRLLMFGQEQKFRQVTLDLARIQPGERVLEVGCGTGTLSLAAKARAGAHSQVAGIDIAPDMIETARQKAAKAGLEVAFQVGRIETIPYPDNQFDVVLSSLMMHHVPEADDKQRGLNEIWRVLKPGGRILIVDVVSPKNPLVRGLATLIVGRGMMGHNVTHLIPVVEQAGFYGIESGPTNSSLLGYLRGKKP